MLKKLIKYDFNWINKVMYVYFAILICVTLILKVIESIDQNILIVILDKIMSGTFIAFVINTIITCIIRIWARFVQNLYKDESYLTHTLPVTKKQLFNSKVIASVLSLLLSMSVVIVCIAIIYLNSTTIYEIKNIYQSLVNIYNAPFAVIFIICVVLLILLEVFCIVMVGMFGITIGHRSNNYKMIKSIVVGFLSYIAYNIISLIIMLILSEIFSFEITSETLPKLSTIATIGLTFIISFAVYNFIFYVLSKHFLNKGVNVE